MVNRAGPTLTPPSPHIRRHSLLGLVSLVYLVCLVCLVRPTKETKQTHKPKKLAPPSPCPTNQINQTNKTTRQTNPVPHATRFIHTRSLLAPERQPPKELDDFSGGKRYSLQPTSAPQRHRLAGCGTTILIRENFYSLHVWHNGKTLPQDAQKGRSARPQRVKGRGVRFGTLSL